MWHERWPVLGFVGVESAQSSLTCTLVPLTRPWQKEMMLVEINIQTHDALDLHMYHTLDLSCYKSFSRTYGGNGYLDIFNFDLFICMSLKFKFYSKTCSLEPLTFIVIPLTFKLPLFLLFRHSTLQLCPSLYLFSGM